MGLYEIRKRLKDGRVVIAIDEAVLKRLAQIVVKSGAVIQLVGERDRAEEAKSGWKQKLRRMLQCLKS